MIRPRSPFRLAGLTIRHRRVRRRPVALVFRRPPRTRPPAPQLVVRAGDQISVTLAPRFTVVLQQVARAAAVVGRPDRTAPSRPGAPEVVADAGRLAIVHHRWSRWAPPLASIARPGDRAHERRALVRPAGSDPAARGRPVGRRRRSARSPPTPPTLGSAPRPAAPQLVVRGDAPAKRGSGPAGSERDAGEVAGPVAARARARRRRPAAHPMGRSGISRLGDRPPLRSAAEIVAATREPRRRGASSWRWVGRPGRRPRREPRVAPVADRLPAGAIDGAPGAGPAAGARGERSRRARRPSTSTSSTGSSGAGSRSAPAPSASAAGEREVVVRQQLTKATVEVLAGSAQGRTIEVLFNPTEYSVEHSASFQETAPPGLDNPITQFVNGNAQVLTMDLLFDTYTDGGGAGRVGADPPAHRPAAHRRRPPRPADGPVLAGACSSSRRSSRRSASGSPCSWPTARRSGPRSRSPSSSTRRSRSSCEHPRRNSADKTKRRMVEGPDDLWLLADREYGDVAHWRLIARANRIDDPRRSWPATVLVLPPLDGRDDGGAAWPPRRLTSWHANTRTSTSRRSPSWSGERDVVRELFLAVSSVQLDLKERTPGQFSFTVANAFDLEATRVRRHARRPADRPARAVRVRQPGARSASATAPGRRSSCRAW